MRAQRKIPLAVVAMALGSLGLLATTSCEDDRLSYADGAPCYTGPERTLGVGECRAGVWSSSISACRLEVLPAIEDCDGLDNDCDAETDELADIRRSTTFGKVCNGGRADLDYGYLSDCSLGTLECQNGSWACFGVEHGSSEKCDGRDNDCNGRVDDIPPSLCYSGDVRQLLLRDSACKAGVVQCDPIWWSEYCHGEVTPIAEVCGNSLDDDCDGAVDEPAENAPQAMLDVVFHIDRSGSMDEEIERVVQVIQTVAQQLDVTYDVRWAAMAFPDPDEDTYPFILAPFGSAGDLIEALKKLELDGGVEPVYDSVVMAVNDEQMKWRNASTKIHLIWTDEPGRNQSAHTEADAARVLREAGHLAVVFCSPFDYGDYDALGRFFPISSASVEFIATLLLDQVLLPRCQ